MKRVMIVEDEKLVLWGITSLFEKHDQYAIVGSFSNPLEALDEIRKQQPDLVITDISMPQMDGITLIKQVKDFDPQIHIIVLSCYDDFEIVHNAFKLGIDDYILKHELEEDRLFSILKGLDAA
ncbi:MAG: response regulator, partial [Spirochaetales bacterium]|nr:response regulator [Spirochaetales bacterium]